MDQENTNITATNVVELGGKSWTAYFWSGIFAIVLLLLSVAFLGANIFGGLIVLSVSLLIIALRFYSIKSHRLYMDDIGVWRSSGILPWTKGTSGVKWRDLDEAVFFKSMFSWMFKSYSIRIGHRFTKDSEVFLDHWDRGDKAVMAINARHQELVRANALH
ncbi:hypothetical protein [Rhodoferax saidenbachensis]|uniref:DUF304 domain-containing protein n=1 Tax=Rhodoferax saidenbachensis TaxID=1484693 RepID=A0ABU1ZIF2_9BURK|nr:hypothetical protein [Rhodoferax saidenbachensis]MDR7305317.1 hypothetical protein [Rhodoferax saidenbachensis]